MNRSVGLDSLPRKERRGSRARCILLTEGHPHEVADALTALVQPFALVRPGHDRWLPQGFAARGEARLGESAVLLSGPQRAVLTRWWLAEPGRGNTPNWDIAATALVGQRAGLVLVEAKAHVAELKPAGFGATHSGNARRIRTALCEANDDLCRSGADWNLACGSHYQLANRFAWGWKLASLGVPVVLVYLGFLNAVEMNDRGRAFESRDAWESVNRPGFTGDSVS